MSRGAGDNDSGARPHTNGTSHAQNGEQSVERPRREGPRPVRITAQVIGDGQDEDMPGRYEPGLTFNDINDIEEQLKRLDGLYARQTRYTKLAIYQLFSREDNSPLGFRVEADYAPGIENNVVEDNPQCIKNAAIEVLRRLKDLEESVMEWDRRTRPT